MAEKVWKIEDLKNLGFTESEAKKMLPLVNSGKTPAEAYKEIMKTETIVKSKDPVGAVMADTMSKITDIAIQRVDNGSGTPVFLINAGGKEKTADLNTLIKFLQEIVRENSSKGPTPEIKQLQKELAELKELLAEKEKAEEQSKLDELEARIEMQISRLQDAINKQHIPVGDKIDVADLFQVLNQNGTLNQMLRLAEQFLQTRAKQLDIQRNMSLLDKALVLANQVDDVDKISRLIKVLKELSTPENDIEIVPEDED